MIHPEYLYVDGIDISKAVVNVVKKYQEILFNKDNVFVQKLDTLKTLEENAAKKSALQEFLNMCYADTRNVFGEMILNQPSQFLDEIKQDHVNHIVSHHLLI